MERAFNQAKELIAKSSRILLTTHERTDGDDLGTVLALYHELQRQGKYAHVTVTGSIPQSLLFLPGSGQVTENVPNTEFDLLIVSGCSNKDRIGNVEIANLQIPTINIDHHPDNALFGQVNVVDPKKSAVAELTYDFFKYVSYTISPEVATCLLTGIFTDTGSFMHSNTGSSTLMAASYLMRRGAPIARIARNTYGGKNEKVLKAWSKAFANTYLHPEQKMVYSVITDEDLKDLEDAGSGAFEGFVETLNKIPEAKFAMFLKQDGKVVKGSLRSDPYKKVDVGQLARTLGGGGHKWASGFSILGKLVKNELGKWELIN